MVHDLGQDARSFDERLTDARVVGAGVEQDAVELQARADFDVAVIDLDNVSFTDPVLP